MPAEQTPGQAHTADNKSEPLKDAPGREAVETSTTIAVVQGEPFTQLPLDLYIPPDALEVILEAFEGPLDLLLYLIKRQNLDILNIPISDITAQYMKYIGLLKSMRFELAAEYLVMAAMLAEIKSRMLLPRMDEDSEDENDPRAELIRRLQEYEQIKQGAVSLDELPRLERNHQVLKVVAPDLGKDVPLPDITMKELMMALRDVMDRAEQFGEHSILRETLSVRARMSQVLSVLMIGKFCEFSTLFNPEEGRMGVVVTFLAILELCKDSAIDIVQSEPYAPIYLQPKSETIEPHELSDTSESQGNSESSD
ncbi:MAG: segregation/condensation protein A [Granulosicoccus sp.]|nr:segregation/condensation protein A [Granulosicoccus sp.]